MKTLTLICAACLACLRAYGQLTVSTNTDGSITVRVDEGVAAAPLRTTPAQVPARTVSAPTWATPRMSRVTLSEFEPSPDAVNYRLYIRSSRTTNQWVWHSIIAHPPPVPVVVTLDLGVPVETRITAVSSGGLESAPTNPVRVPAIVPPRPPGQPRWLYNEPIVPDQPLRRSRVRPEPILPPTPLPE